MSLKLLEKSGITIDWKAWKLPHNANPTTKPEGYAIGAKNSIEKLIKATGLIIQSPTNKSDSYLAHVGAKYAKSKERFNEYHQRIFQAVWERDEDIGDLVLLSNIAKEIGLNKTEFLEAINGDMYKEMVEEDFKQANEDKVWTIPSFIGKGGVIQVHHYQDLPTLKTINKIL